MRGAATINAAHGLGLVPVDEIGDRLFSVAVIGARLIPDRVDALLVDLDELAVLIVGDGPDLGQAFDIVIDALDRIRFGDDRPILVGDDLTLSVIRNVQQAGVLFAGGAIWKGRWVLRLSVIGYQTTEADARLSIEGIKASWHEVALAAA